MEKAGFDSVVGGRFSKESQGAGGSKRRVVLSALKKLKTKEVGEQDRRDLTR